MNRGRAKELSKSLLLIFLIFSAAFLSCRVWIYGEMFPEEQYSLRGMIDILRNGGLQNYDLLDESEQSAAGGALFTPLWVRLNDNGETRTVKGSARLLHEAHTAVKDALLASYGQGLTLQKIENTDEWTQVLQNSGLLVDYGMELTTEVYWEHMGVPSTAKVDQAVFRYMALQADGIYLRAQDGSLYFAQRSGLSDFSAAMDPVRAMQPNSNTYQFALQQDDTGMAAELGLGQEQLMPTGLAIDTVLSVSDPLTEEMAGESIALSQGILKRFGFNPQMPGQYSELGRRTYVSNASVLRLSTGGLVEYHVTGIPRKGISILNTQNTADDRLSTYELIKGVYEFLSGLDGSLLGGKDTELRYAGMQLDDGGSQYTLYFRYTYEGTEIWDENGGVNGCPISVTVQGGYITAAKIRTRSYLPTELKSPGLQWKSVLASFTAERGGELRRCYVDDGQSESVMAAYLLEQKKN